jgi:hypothetical protein
MGLSNSGNALLAFDPDGPGPLPEELYVGGSFNSAGGVPGTQGIARWNGVRWASVGVSPSTFCQVLSTFDPDGSGPQPARLAAVGSSIFLWDGAQWTTLAPRPVLDLVADIIEFDADGSGPELPKLVACGLSSPFSQEPSVFVLSGTAWQALPLLPVIEARALAVFDEDGAGPANPSLFVAMDGGGGLAKLVGNQWQIVGGGLSRSGQYLCNTLAVADLDGPGPERSVLLAGGDFTTAGGASAQGIAAWTGTQWRPMSLATPTVESFAVVDYTQGTGAPTLYAHANGAVVRWNPASTSWTVVGVDGSYFPLPVARHDLAPFRGSGELVPSLYLTGRCTVMNSVPSNYFARLKCQNCYANCDLSAGQPALTANDFSCFLNQFAASDPYANCDGSTGTPTQTANDFLCFINAYAAGCP